MPINPNIPLSGTPLQFQSTTAADMRASRNASMQNALTEMQLQEAMTKTGRATSLRNALRDSRSNPLTERDAYATFGEPGDVLAYDKHRSGLATDAATTRASTLKGQNEGAKYAGQRVGSVVDQSSLDAYLKDLTRLGVPTDGLNPIWTPGYSEAVQKQMMSLTDRMGQENADRTYSEMQLNNQRTEDTREMDSMGIPRGTPEWNAEMERRNTKPQRLTKFTPGGGMIELDGNLNADALKNLADVEEATSFATGRGKESGKAYAVMASEIMAAGFSADLENAKLDRLNGLLKDVETGLFKGQTQALKKAALRLGIDLGAVGVTDDVALVTAAQILSKELTLSALPWLKIAPTSNTDLAYVADAQASVSMTESGRKLVIDGIKAQNRRIKGLRTLAIAYTKKHKGLDVGFEEERDAYLLDNPLFKAATEKEYGALKIGDYYVHPRDVEQGIYVFRQKSSPDL